MSNLAEAMRAKVIAYDPTASLYVVKDAEGKIWGVKSEKLRPQPVSHCIHVAQHRLLQLALKVLDSKAARAS